ncbi:MAG: hypothetical protein HYZ10_14950 [Ignavibacteriales bacterium]|nr:hypothetical protein [Ignavibacteriales bacterium]
MKKFSSCFYLLLFLTSGCSYQIMKSDYSQTDAFYKKVNDLCESKMNIKILTSTNEQVVADELRVFVDSTQYYDRSLNTIKKIPTKNIIEIQFEGTGSSIFEGILFGGLAGGILGNILSNPATPGFEKAGSVLGGILLGSLSGIITAIIWPSNTHIIFNNLEQK